MIVESWPWKRDLIKDADILERWSRKPPSQRRGFLIEKKIFVAAYSMRKLLEANKLSTTTMTRNLACLVYPAMSTSITPEDRHRFDELYDLSSPVKRRLSARALLSMIVHSLVFAEGLGEGFAVSSFYITSDKTKLAGLWELDFCAFVGLMRTAGNDHPSTSVRVFDREKGDWFIWSGDGDPPRDVKRKMERLLNRSRA